LPEPSPPLSISIDLVTVRPMSREAAAVWQRAEGDSVAAIVGNIRNNLDGDVAIRRGDLGRLVGAIWLTDCAGQAWSLTAYQGDYIRDVQGAVITLKPGESWLFPHNFVVGSLTGAQGADTWSPACGSAGWRATTSIRAEFRPAGGESRPLNLEASGHGTTRVIQEDSTP
jgi:hypothetical protein